MRLVEKDYFFITTWSEVGDTHTISIIFIGGPCEVVWEFQLIGEESGCSNWTFCSIKDFFATCNGPHHIHRTFSL